MINRGTDSSNSPNWKKLLLALLETSPELPRCANFGPKKQFSVKVLRGLQMTCALELKLSVHNNEDPWEKINHFKNSNCQNTNPIVFFSMWLLYREFQYLKWLIFSHGSSLLCTESLSSKAQVIWSPLSTCTENCFLGPKLAQCGSSGEVSST